jgi:hypothetical protein
MKKIFAGLLLSLIAPLSANALPLTFEFSGQCLTNCSAIGLSSGGTVSGSITASDGYADDGILSASELVDYSFTFGTYIVSTSTHTVSGALALYSDLLEGLRFASNDTFLGVSLSAANTGSLLGLSGWTVRQVLTITTGTGEYVGVPEPATITMLGVGLLGFAAARRARGRRA